MQGMIKHESAEHMLLTTDKYMCCAVQYLNYCTLMYGYCSYDGTCEFHRMKCTISRLKIWVKLYYVHLKQE